MAFRGSFEKKKINGVEKKVLLTDFCTSSNNFEKSRWPKPKGDMTDMQKLLERMSDDYNLETTGINVYLEWDTGSDLDINVMCGCGNWHGYGTSGGSGGSCRCEKCGMTRDHDITTGTDGRTGVFEHAYFTNLNNLYDKEIGMGVYNYTQRSDRSQNDFKMALFNEFGYQLFPVKNGPKAVHEATWMYTKNVSGDSSTKKTYRFMKGDELLGREQFSNNFATHAGLCVKPGEKSWNFNAEQAKQEDKLPLFMQYKKTWNDKWRLVKDVLCSPDFYDCEVLDAVCDV